MLIFKEIQKEFIANHTEEDCFTRLSDYGNNNFSLAAHDDLNTKCLSTTPPVFECTMHSFFLAKPLYGALRTKILVQLDGNSETTKIHLRTKTGYYYIILAIAWILYVSGLIYRNYEGLHLTQLAGISGLMILLLAIDRISKKMLVSRVTSILMHP